MPTKIFPALGERIPVIGNYSEVMMHFGLAGKPIEIALVRSGKHPDGRWMAQVYFEGRPFSAPITTGEAGFYHEPGQGYYTYQRPNPTPWFSSEKNAWAWLDLYVLDVTMENHRFAYIDQPYDCLAYWLVSKRGTGVPINVLISVNGRLAWIGCDYGH